MSYRNWYDGMKVVCVDARASDEYAPRRDRYVATTDDMSGLEEGRIYTVRSTCDFYGVVGVRLHEILRPHSKFGIEVPFAAARFRPVQKRKTDISIFTAMLTPTKVEA